MDRRKIIAAMLVAAGVVMLSIPIYYHFHGQNKTDELTQQFEEILEEKANEEAESEEEMENNTEATLSEDDATLFAEGEVIAILEIEGLDIRYPVVEGCSATNLNYAIGHMSETADVGEIGNCVLAGHNGSRYGEFFTNLNQVNKGDVVTLLDREAVLHRYEVKDYFVVSPYDNSIRTQGEDEELTLFTCAEKGTKRFVVKCEPME